MIVALFTLLFSLFPKSFKLFEKGTVKLDNEFSYTYIEELNADKTITQKIYLQNLNNENFLLHKATSYVAREYRYKIYILEDRKYFVTEVNGGGSSGMFIYNIYNISKSNPTILYSNYSLSDGLSCFEPVLNDDFSFTFYLTSSDCDLRDSLLGRIFFNNTKSYTLKITSLIEEPLGKVEI